jgi:hypothetical protein
MEQNQLSVDFFGRYFFPFFAKQNEQALFFLSDADGRLKLKSFVLNTTDRLFNDVPFPTYVTTFQVVHKILGNDFDVKSCECSGVPCKSPLNVALSRAAASSSLEKKVYSFRLVHLCQKYPVREKKCEAHSGIRRRELASKSVSQ